MKIKLQDLTATITGTSRYNNGAFDTVHVETLLVTDKALPTEMNWYVPNGSSVPPEILSLFQATKLKMVPTLEENLLSGTEDIHEQAKEGLVEEVKVDAAKLLARSIMKKTALIPVPGSTNTYLLHYDYKLYPTEQNKNAFDFNITLPFDGLTLPNGGRVQVSVLTPIAAKIDQTATKGIDENGREITEQVVHLGNANRYVVNFGYQLDPDFTIRYVY